MPMTKTNPYDHHPGFGFRVARATKALRRLGKDCLAHIYTRGFDNCFEMGDGKAVVWALMHAALGDDDLLKRGIENMGKAVWPHWLEVYEHRKAEPHQLSLFV